MSVLRFALKCQIETHVMRIFASRHDCVETPLKPKANSERMIQTMFMTFNGPVMYAAKRAVVVLVCAWSHYWYCD